MRLIIGLVSGLLIAAPAARAQTADDVWISVGGFQLDTNGAERPGGVWLRTGPLTIGRPTVGIFSMFGCGYFALTVPPKSFDEKATAGWRVEVTPLKVVNHVVTFRLRWVRALDKGSGLEPAHEDVEVTLKPGESRPLDSVQVVRDGTKTFDGGPCTTKSASLQVSADFPDLDRRLIGADIWLVERLPNGQEQSQPLSVRGVPNRPIPFYFDSVRDGAKRLDIFGKLIADPLQGDIEISLEAIRADPNPEQERGYQSARWFRSTLRIKPNEVVDVALARPDDKNDPWANRRFSIRIQAKQIR